jgi:hypothetical protein
MYVKDEDVRPDESLTLTSYPSHNDFPVGFREVSFCG